MNFSQPATQPDYMQVNSQQLYDVDIEPELTTSTTSTTSTTLTITAPLTPSTPSPIRPSQKCTKCRGWLYNYETIINDPSSRYGQCHQQCLIDSNSSSDSNTNSNTNSNTPSRNNSLLNDSMPLLEQCTPSPVKNVSRRKVKIGPSGKPMKSLLGGFIYE